MSALGLRQRAIVAMLGVVALYAIAVGCWFLHAENAWKKAAKTYAKACQTYRDETKLIREKPKLLADYEAEKANMPTFEMGKSTDTTWLRKIGEMAERNHIAISQLQAGREVAAGEVLELPLEVKSLEGALESIVKFMHELENTSEGMFDIKALSIKPSNKRGYLKGSCTITCAYMRGEAASGAAEKGKGK